MSLRESPVRKRPSGRPPWLIALVIAVGIVVLAGIVYGLVSLVRGPAEPTAEETTAAPTPCATATVAVSEVLPAASKVTVNVYNATDTSGLASKTATALEKRDFTVGKVGNDPVGKPITGVAQIRFGPKAALQAQVLLLQVPGAEMVELQRGGKKVDLAMGDTFNGLAPQEDVDAQLAAPTPVASGPGCPSS